jgi:hypothetical protein
MRLASLHAPTPHRIPIKRAPFNGIRAIIGPKISKDPKTQAPPIGISLALFGENGKV